MIDITKHIKINVFTVILFVLGFLFHFPIMFYITYAVMLMHEAAHATAAVCIGLRIDCIVLQPFGLNVRLKNKLIPSLADEIILYAAGPLVNAFAAFISAMLYIKCGMYGMKLFSMTNLALFAVNLLPALPLDGGYMLKKILISVIGYKKAFMVMHVISILICGVLIALGAYTAYISRNFSVLLFASLIFGNLFISREKYDMEYISAAVAGHI